MSDAPSLTLRRRYCVGGIERFEQPLQSDPLVLRVMWRLWIYPESRFENDAESQQSFTASDL